jgi:hypothetical protein
MLMSCWLHIPVSAASGMRRQKWDMCLHMHIILFFDNNNRTGFTFVVHYSSEWKKTGNLTATLKVVNYSISPVSRFMSVFSIYHISWTQSGICHIQ